MTNKFVIIINSLKVPKIKKILLYEMKFLVPNYQKPWLGGYRHQIPVLSVLNWICWHPPPPEQNSWVRRCSILILFVPQIWSLGVKVEDSVVTLLDSIPYREDVWGCSRVTAHFLIPTLGGVEWYVSYPVALSPGKGFFSSPCRRKSGWPPGRMDAEEKEKSMPLPGIEPRFHGIRPVTYPVYGEIMPVSWNAECNMTILSNPTWSAWCLASSVCWLS